MNKAIFLDRDGTLNDDTKGYTHKIEDYQLLPGVIEGLKMLKDFKLFIITNQSGIGRRIYTEEQFLEFNNHLVQDLKKKDIHIIKTHHCPHTPDRECDCRKPSTKWISVLAKEHGIDLSQSWVIGDHPCDVEMGLTAGCRAIYLLTGHGEKHRHELSPLQPMAVSKNFLEAARFIQEHEKR